LATNAQLELLSSATQLYFDAAFKVLPTIYYQLFTLFVVVSRKTTELYVKVFQKVQQLVPQFTPTCAMADFEESSVAGFQHICPDAGVAAGVGSTMRKQLSKFSTTV